MRRTLPPLPAWCTSEQHSFRLELRVPFADTDAMGIVWHGNYLKYCERAREALAATLNWDVDRLMAQGLQTPIIASNLIHHKPCTFNDLITIEATLYATQQPRLLHRYNITHNDMLIVEAETEQVFTDHEGNLLLSQPTELSNLLAPS